MKIFNRNIISRLSEINRISIPLVLNSISAMLILLIDQAMIGRISLEAFGAVGLIGSTIYAVTGVVGAICVGLNILGSRSKGREDNDDMENKFNASIALSIFVGVFFFVIVFLFKGPFLRMIYGLEGKILEESIKYTNIISITIGLNMLLFMLATLFKILKDTKVVLFTNITVNIINVILNYILIFGHLGFSAMGVTGAALASVVALSVGVLIYFAIIKYKKILNIKFVELKKNIRELIKESLPIIGEVVLESTLFVLCINAIIARLGVLEISAYTLVASIANVLLMSMWSYSSTTLTLVSESFAKDDKGSMDLTPKLSLFMVFVYYFTFSLIVIVFKAYIPKLITDDSELIKTAALFIPIAVFANIFHLPSTVYKFSLQGISMGSEVLKLSFVVNMVSLIFMLIFTFVLRLGLTGIYLGLGINYLLLSIVFYAKYRWRVNCYV